MKKLIVFLMVLSLIFMSVALNVFAVFSSVQIGPTTDLDGDVNIPAGSDYYKDSTLLAITDLTTDELVQEAMLNAVAGPSDEDILTWETDSSEFEWHTQGELSLASSGANTDITSILNVGLYVGRDSDNRLNWTTDDNLEIWIGGVEHDITGIDTGTGDNDTLVTQGYVDDKVSADGAIAWDDIGNPDANDEIDFTTYSIEFSFDSGGELQIGDGGATNYFQVDHTGAVTFGGTGTITLPDDVVTAAMIDSVGAGVNLTWDAADDELDVDDVFILHAGDIATGVHDFGGADSFEIPNKDADPANIGELILDTSVADMTNGNLAFHDGTTIRYVVSLAAADIWSADNYVVAYSAGSDKFFMKEDTSSAGNFVFHLMDVNAADEEYYLNDETADSGDIFGGGLLNKAAYARNVTTTGSAVAGTVTVTGTLADGTVGASEGIPIINGVSQGEIAFMNITAMTVAGASNTFDVGIGDIIGLPNAFNANTDIYMKTVDGVDDFDQITGNVDTTENTLDCSTIVQNEDITIYYHN